MSHVLSGLRVAHLIESDGPGGAERMLATLVREQARAGAEPLVVVPARGEGWLARQLEGSGVAIEPFHLERPVSLAAAARLTGLLRAHRVAIAHAHEFAMAVYGAWAAWRAGIPHVATMHGGRYYARKLRRRVALRATAGRRGRLVAVSRDLALALGRDLWLGRSRVPVIPNGACCEPPPQSTLRDELGLTADDRVLLSVGNLYPVKGHRFAVAALALLAPRHPRAHLAIAGRGENAVALERQAQALGVGDRVHLLGLRHDVANLLAGADVFVLPSLSEGLPIALLEAMLAGLPVVASDVGDVRDALDDGHAGALARPGDPQALATALDLMLSAAERARTLAERAQARARAEYSVPAMVQRYSTLYEDLL